MNVNASIVTLELAKPVTIARGTFFREDIVQLEVRYRGLSGFGEAAPADRYGESAATALTYLNEHDQLIGGDPFASEEIFERLPRREFAARAGLDAALHDLRGKLFGEPTWRLLGLRRIGPATSRTIALASPDAMSVEAEGVAGAYALKLKLGGRDGLDADRVRAVRDVSVAPILVDVNEAWTFDEALELLPVLAELGVEYCEQPLPAGDPRAVRLKLESPLPIYADEECHTLADVATCAGRAHGINVKLAKSGGIGEAVRMVHAARSLGLGCMLGCMLESTLGIAAGAQIAGLFDYVDLDGNLVLSHDRWQGVGLVEGVQLPSARPGLGVEPRPTGSLDEQLRATDT